MENKKKKPVAKKEEESFIDEDDDKKVIVFVVIGILIVVGVIICFVIGCDKKDDEEPNDEPNVIIPVDDDEKEKEDVVVEDEEIETTVKKVSTKKDDKILSFNVIYYFGNRSKRKLSAKESEALKKFVPEGYSSCKYYYDNDYQYEVDFSKKVTSNMEIYMKCTLETYTIEYIGGSNVENIVQYDVQQGEIVLLNATTQNIFSGWYTDPEYKNKVTKIDKYLAKYADSNNVIKLYAKIIEQVNLAIYPYGDGEADENVFDGVIPTYESCPDGSSFMGYSLSKTDSTIKYHGGDEPLLTEDTNLYAVCGVAKVVYQTKDDDGNVVEEVEVSYTEEEVAEYELPTPNEVGLETPTYFVPVEEPTDNSKKVIDDSINEINDDEVRLQDVIDKAAPGYTPQVNDNVVEKEKVFDGWEEPAPTVEEPQATEPVEEDWKPEVADPVVEENLEANWELQPEDATEEPLENPDSAI